MLARTISSTRMKSADPGTATSRSTRVLSGSEAKWSGPVRTSRTMAPKVSTSWGMSGKGCPGERVTARGVARAAAAARCAAEGEHQLGNEREGMPRREGHRAGGEHREELALEVGGEGRAGRVRPEEHTSELQSP